MSRPKPTVLLETSAGEGSYDNLYRIRRLDRRWCAGRYRFSQRRLDTAKRHLEAMGGRFTAFWMTLGEHDVVFVYEAPDDAVAARFSLMLNRLGMVRTKTLKAFPEAAYREIIASLS